MYEVDLARDSLRIDAEFAGSVSDPSTRWRFSRDRASTIASSAEGVSVYRIDDGSERWTRRERVWLAPIGYTEVNRTILAAVSRAAGEAFALDLHTGAELWRVEFTDKITPPTMVGVIAAGPDLLLIQRGFLTRCRDGRAPAGEQRYLGTCTAIHEVATLDPLRVFLVSTLPNRNGLLGGDLVNVYGDGAAQPWRSMFEVVPLLALADGSVLMIERGRYGGQPDALQVRALLDGATRETQPWTAGLAVTAAAQSEDNTRVALGTEDGRIALFALDP